MSVFNRTGHKSIVGLALAVAAILVLSACGKTETGISTAERVRLVEEKQNAENRAKAAQPVAAATSTQAVPSKSSAALR